MVRILVTGASGFIGAQLVNRLVKYGAPTGQQIEEIVLLDVRFDRPPVHPSVRLVQGSVGDASALTHAWHAPFDFIFHLASVAGGLAESNFDLGMEVNLVGTMRLLERARQQSRAPVLIFSSSIGVYGDLPDDISDDTPAKPNWSYGTQKLICEHLMTDYTRRGWVDARSLRLPGIVARPSSQKAALSTFLSDLIRDVASGKPFVCPMSPPAHSWWMSVECCVDNLMHAALLPDSRINTERLWTLPPLCATIQEVLDGLARVYGVEVEKLVTYAPQHEIEERFGRLPVAQFPKSDAIGFHHDGSIDLMVQRAVAWAGCQPKNRKRVEV